MTEVYYREAIQDLLSGGVEFDYNFPKSDQLISELEKNLGHKLPNSYKAMLREFGILGFDGQDIYGIGLQDLSAKSPFNVLYSTMGARERGEITNRMVKFMVSGYGPFFVIDCSQRDVSGESPIYEVHEKGYQSGLRKVADSFGEFLRNEVKMYLENR
jgi:hypothetical protein